MERSVGMSAPGRCRDGRPRSPLSPACGEQHRVSAHHPRFAAIIGAMKCGTTTLFDCLSQHPQITVSSPKEPMYFSRNGRHVDITTYRNFWKSYNPAIHDLLVEASTEYTKQPDFPDVAPRIAEFTRAYDLDFRFLYIVRDPLRMIESGLIHGQHQYWSSGNRNRLLRHLIDIADFESQIANYRKLFSDERIRVVQLEKLIGDKNRQLKKLFEFLGVQGHDFLNGIKVAAKNTQAERNQSVAARRVIEKMPARSALTGAWALLPKSLRGDLRPTLHRFAAPWAQARAEIICGPRWTLCDDERDEIKRRLEHSIAGFTERYKIDRSLWTI